MKEYLKEKGEISWTSMAVLISAVRRHTVISTSSVVRSVGVQSIDFSRRTQRCKRLVTESGFEDSSEMFEIEIGR